MRRLLLDTHILLWVMQESPQLSMAARRLLDDAEAVHVSAVSLWEIAIKAAVGKLQIDQTLLDASLGRIGFLPLHVSWSHARAVRTLPLLHADPFDRMLVAQAMSESLHFVTHDSALGAYSGLVLVV